MELIKSLLPNRIPWDYLRAMTNLRRELPPPPPLSLTAAWFWGSKITHKIAKSKFTNLPPTFTTSPGGALLSINSFF